MIDDEDRELFRSELDDVRPIKRVDRHRQRTKPQPEPLHSRRSDREVMAELLQEDPDLARVQTGEELSYLAEGYQKRVLRRLRRGQYTRQGELDLHHMRRQEAHVALFDFLDEAHHLGVTCVKVIHGKARGAEAEPVLKNMVNSLLRRRREVVAFASAPPRDGGTGAVYVLLSPRK